MPRRSTTAVVAALAAAAGTAHAFVPAVNSNIGRRGSSLSVTSAPPAVSAAAAEVEAAASLSPTHFVDLEVSALMEEARALESEAKLLEEEAMALEEAAASAMAMATEAEAAAASEDAPKEVGMSFADGGAPPPLFFTGVDENIAPSDRATIVEASEEVPVVEPTAAAEPVAVVKPVAAPEVPTATIAPAPSSIEEVAPPSDRNVVSAVVGTENDAPTAAANREEEAKAAPRKTTSLRDLAQMVEVKAAPRKTASLRDLANSVGVRR